MGVTFPNIRIFQPFDAVAVVINTCHSVVKLTFICKYHIEVKKAIQCNDINLFKFHISNSGKLKANNLVNINAIMV